MRITFADKICVLPGVQQVVGGATVASNVCKALIDLAKLALDNLSEKSNPKAFKRLKVEHIADLEQHGFYILLGIFRCIPVIGTLVSAYRWYNGTEQDKQHTIELIPPKAPAARAHEDESEHSVASIESEITVSESADRPSVSNHTASTEEDAVSPSHEDESEHSALDEDSHEGESEGTDQTPADSTIEAVPADSQPPVDDGSAGSSFHKDESEAVPAGSQPPVDDGSAGSSFHKDESEAVPADSQPPVDDGSASNSSHKDESEGSIDSGHEADYTDVLLKAPESSFSELAHQLNVAKSKALRKKFQNVVKAVTTANALSKIAKNTHAEKVAKQEKIAKYETMLKKRLEETEKTIKGYQLDIRVIKKVIDTLLTLPPEELAKRGKIDQGTPQFHQFMQCLNAFSIEFGKQAYDPTYSAVDNLYARTQDTINLMETDLKRNKNSAKFMAKYVTNFEFIGFVTNLQGSLTPAECATIAGKLQKDEMDRVLGFSALKDFDMSIKNPTDLNFSKAIQIPLKYPLFTNEVKKGMEDLLKLKESMDEGMQKAVQGIYEFVLAKQIKIVNLFNEINTGVQVAEERQTKMNVDLALELWLHGSKHDIRQFQIARGLRNSKEELLVNAVSKTFKNATGSEPMFHLLCKSIDATDLGLILDSKEISEPLKKLIISKLDSDHGHAKLSRVRLLANLYTSE